MNVEWAVRVRAERDEARVTAGKHAWTLGPALAVGDGASSPTALHAFLGSVAADIGSTFRSLAEKRRVALDALEVLAQARLDNPLVALGVIGEEGSPACSELRVTLFVASSAAHGALEQVWSESLRRAPVVATLSLTRILTLEWRMV